MHGISRETGFLDLKFPASPNFSCSKGRMESAEPPEVKDSTPAETLGISAVTTVS